MSLLLLLSLAYADDFGATEVTEEIDIWAEDAVRRARQQVENNLHRLGYTREKRKDGRTIYKHVTNWKGKVVVHDDGWVTYRRQPPRIQRPGSDSPMAQGAAHQLAWFGCITRPTECVKIGGIVVSGRKLDQQKARTHQAISSDLNAYADRLADRSTRARVDGLPERLQALWDHGTPLEAGQPVAETPEARRAAILRFYQTRTRNPWGDQVREAVAAFIRGEVQHSEHPYPAAELAALKTPAGG